MLLVTVLTKIIDMGIRVANKTQRFISDLYLICFSENRWIIDPTGQFINKKFFAIENSYKDYWVYADNRITHINKTEGQYKNNRMPYLSCIFKHDEISVSMDDFLENTRCNDVDELTLPVMMAAFSIRERTLFNWYNAEFDVINRNGDKITFNGKSVLLPVET